jgi:2-methylisocitrate lyase-like PEP mutase family enzyme
MGQRVKGEVFWGLHREGVFVVANAWDVGSARVLGGLGFAALATSSGGLAFASGRPDGSGLLSREEVLANAAAIAGVTSLPVSVDLESGYGDSPEEVAETVRLAGEVGLVGGSVEDTTGRADVPIMELGQAVERVAAAVEAARALPFRFTLTARADNFLHGRPDLGDTIERLRAFEAVGADVLYAPGLPDAEAIRAVCSSVSKPVNVLASTAVGSVAELAVLGVRRVSLGSGLARVALGAVIAAATETAERGTFGYLADAPSYAQVNSLLDGPAR